MDQSAPMRPELRGRIPEPDLHSFPAPLTVVDELQDEPNPDDQATIDFVPGSSGKDLDVSPVVGGDEMPSLNIKLLSGFRSPLKVAAHAGVVERHVSVVCWFNSDFGWMDINRLVCIQEAVVLLICLE